MHTTSSKCLELSGLRTSDGCCFVFQWNGISVTPPSKWVSEKDTSQRKKKTHFRGGDWGKRERTVERAIPVFFLVDTWEKIYIFFLVLRVRAHIWLLMMNDKDSFCGYLHMCDPGYFGGRCMRRVTWFFIISERQSMYTRRPRQNSFIINHVHLRAQVWFYLHRKKLMFMDSEPRHTKN